MSDQTVQPRSKPCQRKRYSENGACSRVADETKSKERTADKGREKKQTKQGKGRWGNGAGAGRRCRGERSACSSTTRCIICRASHCVGERLKGLVELGELLFSKILELVFLVSIRVVAGGELAVGRGDFLLARGWSDPENSVEVLGGGGPQRGAFFIVLK